MEERGESQKSLTDKDARLMKNNGKFSVCYNVQEIVDSKSHIVENYEANNNPADMGSMERVSREAKETMNRRGVIRNVTDQGYKDREDMRKCLERGIIPEVTPGEDKEYEIEFEYEEKEVREEEIKSEKEEDIKKCLRSGVIPEVYKEVLRNIRVEEKTEIKTIEEIESSEEIEENDMRRIAIDKECFVKDKKHNKVYCPSGETLRKKSISKREKKIKYCNKEACKRCKKPCTIARYKEVFMYKSQIILSTGKEGEELKKKYNPQKIRKREKKKVVKVTLKPKEEDLKKRMGTSEHVHGTLKRTDDARYLLLKGKEKVNGELALSYCAVNIRRLINLVGVKEILRHLEERKTKECTV